MKEKRTLWLSVFLFLSSLLFSGHVAFSQEPELAPLNPEFVVYQQNLQQGIITQQVTEEGYGLGFIPPPTDLSHLKGQKVFKSQSLLGFDPSYDLRTTGKLTSVKNQNPYGTCWAFATYGSMESCLLPGETRDFSENNLVNLDGFDLGFNDGGNHIMSTAYLSRWAGPVNESDDPYPNPDASPPGLTLQKHVQEALFLPDRSSSLDNDTIKQAVIDYGAIYTSIYYRGASYNSATAAYYYNGTGSNHAVCIIGWDDNFDKAKFNTAPPENGAFIIKNSWGTGWGDFGYFYISYYDTQVGTYNAVFNNTEAITNYKNIYQYDPLGWVISCGYSSTTGWFSNIFTTGGNQFLNAVSFYAASVNSSYEMYVYTNITAGQPRSGSLAGTKTGTIAIPGYHTIVLDSPISLVSGQKFSIVVKLTTPGYNWPVSIEYPWPDYSTGATANLGESFVSSNGASWTDMTAIYANTNVCLKAFTSVVTHTITASAGLHGTITPSGTITVDDGNDQAFTIAPEAGYHLETLLVDGSKVDTQNGHRTSYTFTLVVADHEITASFAVTPSYTITASAESYGTISPSGAVTVYEGDMPSFIITPDPGYRLDTLLVDSVSVDTQNGSRTSYTFDPVTEDHTIAADFEANPFSGGGGGGGGGGGMAVGPLAVGLSALLGWWKRRRRDCRGEQEM